MCEEILQRIRVYLDAARAQYPGESRLTYIPLSELERLMQNKKGPI